MKAIVMVGLVDPRGWVLLQERDEHAAGEPDEWCLVGGGVEDDETLEAAAYRELREETGIVCDDLVSSAGTSRPVARTVVTGSISSPRGRRWGKRLWSAARDVRSSSSTRGSSRSWTSPRAAAPCFRWSSTACRGSADE